MWQILLFFLSNGLLSVHGHTPPAGSQICLYACQESLWEVTFGTTVSTDDYYTGYCQDTLRFSSTYLCAKQLCSPHEIESGLEYIRHTCEEVDLPIPSFESTIANFSDEAIKDVRVVRQYEISAEEIINSTLLPSRELFDLAYRTNVDWSYISKTHIDYGWALLGFWGIVLLVGIVNRLFAAAVHWRLHDIYQDPEASHDNRHVIPKKARFGRIRRWIQRFIILPAAFGYRHQQPFGWCTIPTRIQTLFVFFYIVVNFVLCAVNYRAFDNNVYWAVASHQTWTYLADRTGTLALVNLPLLWIFASRNDVFLWLTGWNFGTFNVFHKWIARIATVEAIVHSAAYTKVYLNYGGTAELASVFKEEFWYCGVITTIAMSFLLLFSAYPIRQRAYELFLKLHVGLAVITLVCVYYHLKIYEGEYDPYIWPSVAIWSFDHFVRLVRLLILNYKIIFRRDAKMLARYNKDRDIIRLSFTPSYHHEPKAGTHYFIYFPTMLKSFGNHPFTLSSWTSPAGKSPSAPVQVHSMSVDPEKDQSYPPVHTTEEEVGSNSDRSRDAATTTPELQFVIRPYKGLTARLRDLIIKTGTGSREITALVEGPYGQAHPVLSYDSVLFIAGGSGIAAFLPYIQEFLRPRSSHARRAKHIHLVWAARQYAFVRDILDTELAAASTSSRSHVKLDFFITGPTPKAIKSDALGLDRLEGETNISYQRPVVESIIRGEVAEAAGTLAVFVCGPAQLADDTRLAAVRVVGDGFDGLGYFEEQFGW